MDQSPLSIFAENKGQLNNLLLISLLTPNQARREGV